MFAVFGERLIEHALDLTCASNGRVMVLDLNGVHIFSEFGDHISVFKIEGCCCSLSRIAFHNSSGHVVVADVTNDGLCVKMYTKDGEYLRSTQIHTGRISFFLPGVAVTTVGHIAVVCYQFEYHRWNVFIV